MVKKETEFKWWLKVHPPEDAQRKVLSLRLLELFEGEPSKAGKAFEAITTMLKGLDAARVKTLFETLKDEE